MLASAPNEAGRSSLLVASRDCTVPPVGTVMGASVGAEALRETSGPLDMPIPGAQGVGCKVGCRAEDVSQQGPGCAG